VASYGASPEDGGLRALFESSPAAPEARTSAAAEAGFLLGLVAVIAGLFSVTQALSLGAACLGTLFGMVGVATTSRPNVAGRVLAPVGLLLAIAAFLLVILRYLGLDTAFGDAMVPTMGRWLADLNGLLPTA
jgi:hypothetical protein